MPIIRLFRREIRPTDSDSMNCDDNTTVVNYTTRCGKCHKRDANPYMTMLPYGHVCYRCYVGRGPEPDLASDDPQRTLDEIYEEEA